MKLLSPSKVLAQVSAAIPADCRPNVIIIGSLATAYHFFGDDPSHAVRTKDVDCVLAPRIAAVSAGQLTAQTLLDAGWSRSEASGWNTPGTADTPDDQLAAIRLCPPGSDDWFLEFLTVPESEDESGKKWTRVELRDGFFALPSFRFLSLTTFEPIDLRALGIRYARPEMMAFANLLEHPRIKPDLISTAIVGRAIKRSNKDLGRILSIARLSAEGAWDTWPERWLRSLKQGFPSQWRDLASTAGSGLRALLANSNDFEEAHHTCVTGLLAYLPNVTLENLRLTTERVLVEAVEPLEALAHE
jgi:hypothetical protein